jgi:hypothetical protein
LRWHTYRKSGHSQHASEPFPCLSSSVQSKQHFLNVETGHHAAS